jgi:hypothetical protein
MFRNSNPRRGIAQRRPKAVPASTRPVYRTRPRTNKVQEAPISALAFVRPRVERLC